jgi:two-component system cell cycle response regulator
VLIVEDSATMRRVMTRYLRETGYVIFEAGDGEEALTLAARERPDVVLMDVQMPRLDGYGVLASLQTDPELSEVPVVLVTSRSAPEDVAEGLRRGAHDYLRKPFEQPELLARLHAAMRTKTLRDELRNRNAELERLTSIDPLTGLLNRRAAGDQLHALISRSRRHGAALSVIALRVDGLRAVGEVAGHAGQDAALSAVATRIETELREEDAAARWSAEELVVLAPDTDARGARALVARLRGALDAEPLMSGAGSEALAVSIGSATWQAPEDNPEELVRRAAADREGD